MSYQRPTPRYRSATMTDVMGWITAGIFSVRDGNVYKGNRLLAARINKRNRMNTGDPRVDLYHAGKRACIHVSRVVWMATTGQYIPVNFEIHHIDEDPTNNRFENLICVHALDHLKLHVSTGNKEEDF